ncbi:hypothetical protein PL9214520055 [Planktothrix tepida PCC 9214]|uniref:Uncharacterized protein n=1 Tax=Planktothrix tepida PCC 9214 TaxID=671072 RepID=A0A1J1LNK3_9CYAN|nr:hypothetical protein PL9214520055 [Planktothrix tepida PCC 9214]
MIEEKLLYILLDRVKVFPVYKTLQPYLRNHYEYPQNPRCKSITPVDSRR